VPRLQQASPQTFRSNAGVGRSYGLQDRQQNTSEETAWGAQSAFSSNLDSFSGRGPQNAYGQQTFVGIQNFARPASSGYNNISGFDGGFGFSLPSYYEPMSFRSGLSPGASSEATMQSHSLQTRDMHQNAALFTSISSSSSSRLATSPSNLNTSYSFQSGSGYNNTHSDPSVFRHAGNPSVVRQNPSTSSRPTRQLSRSGSDSSLYQTFHSASFSVRSQPFVGDYSQHFSVASINLRPNNTSDHCHSPLQSHPANHHQTGSANSTLSPRGPKRRFAAAHDASVSHRTAASEQTQSQSNVSLFGSPPPSVSHPEILLLHLLTSKSDTCGIILTIDCFLARLAPPRPLINSIPKLIKTISLGNGGNR